MTLLRGPAFGAGTPVTHALVIGVSDYPFLAGPGASDFGAAFGMESLTSAARSASGIAAWLLGEFRKPEAPLATVRALFSPAPGEELHPGVVDALTAAGGATPATREAVERALSGFKADCRSNPDNFAFVYIAGHGVQLTTSASVVLLHDFADPSHGEELVGAIDVAGCHQGLSGGPYPRHQVWFADACRQVPAVARRFETLVGALSASKPVGDVEASALVLAAGPRETAFAEVGGTSLFSQALLWALRGGSAEPSRDGDPGWWVRAGTLATDLQDRIDVLTAAHAVRQLVEPVGRSAPVVVQRFPGPPECDVEVRLSPPDAAPPPTAHVLRNGNEEVPLPGGWPLRGRLPAGLYLIDVDVQPPLTRGWRQIVEVGYPGFSGEAVVG